jgi:hypothetical protein
MLVKWHCRCRYLRALKANSAGKVQAVDSSWVGAVFGYAGEAREAAEAGEAAEAAETEPSGELVQKRIRLFHPSIKRAFFSRLIQPGYSNKI